MRVWVCGVRVCVCGCAACVCACVYLCLGARRCVREHACVFVCGNQFLSREVF